MLTLKSIACDKPLHNSTMYALAYMNLGIPRIASKSVLKYSKTIENRMFQTTKIIKDKQWIEGTTGVIPNEVK